MATIELKNRHVLAGKAKSRFAWLIVLASILLVVAIVLTTLLIVDPDIFIEPGHWRVTLDKLRQGLSKKDQFQQWLVMLGIVVGLLHFIYIRLAAQREKLRLTDTGIEYVSPLRGLLAVFRPGWKVNFSQIREVRFSNMSLGRGPNFITLILDTGIRKHRIIPYNWVEPSSHVPLSPLKETRKWARAGKQAIIDAVMATPVVQALRDSSVRIGKELDLPKSMDLLSSSYALEKNPRALAVVVIFFILLFYFLTDLAVNTEAYAGEPFYHVYIAAGLVAAILAFAWLRAGRVPVAESVMVALLTGGALGAALAPGLLRINQLTDKEGLQPYEYRLEADFSFSPVTGDLPVIRINRYRSYWSGFSIGSLHTFELRRGGLGFYQVNLRPIQEQIREKMK